MTRWNTPLSERFDMRTIPEPNSGCIIWLGAMSGDGYGSINIDGHIRCAHRVNYERVKGLVPDGHVLDHLCRVRLCVNPEHLEPVLHIANVARGRLSEVMRAHTWSSKRRL